MSLQRRRAWIWVAGVAVFALGSVAIPLYLFEGRDNAGETVRPAGAGYSYTVPAGFTVERFHDRFYATNPPGPDESLIRAHRLFRDVTDDDIVVDVSHGNPSAAGAALLESVRREAEDTAAGQGAQVAGFALATVAGHEAVRFDKTNLRLRTAGTQPGAGTSVVDETVYTVAAGTDRVVVLCRWNLAHDAAGLVRTGCAAVIATLQLR